MAQRGARWTAGALPQPAARLWASLVKAGAYVNAMN